MSYLHYYKESAILHASMSGVMGTQFDALLVGDDELMLRSVWHKIENIVKELERRLSRFFEGGEIYEVNCNAAMTPVEVSDLLWSVVSECHEYYKLTEGYFDITLGSGNHLELDEAERSIYFVDESMSIDLGAYGKGCALDLIWEILRIEGIESAFVNFGNSSILAVGHHPCGDSWPISVADPYSGEALAEYRLSNMTLTVSGNTPTHQEHIVDPHTSEFDKRKRVVAVECDDPRLGEALSTAFMLMDVEQSERLYERVKGRIVSRYIKDLEDNQTNQN